ncbi:ABC transporter, ATP-binding protein (cluster 5, nickel/peptides/opines) [hydrothermal vent metagenome]|uniref:ABC transporter, ATP-binding protein (Cluster 5, nickel/peptides/opines) n=1 Tax=hydrothermal vent metagenome TaxID=652676 RepID=A0A3B0Z5I7_9ZZZZ
MNNSQTTPLLRVEDLVTIFESHEQAVHAVDGVSLAIHRGETYALLGESGCGKSMTSFSIMRLLPPAGRVSGGRVMFDGEDLMTLSDAQMRCIRGKRIAMIFQEPMTSLNPVVTIGEQIAESVRLHQGLSGEVVKEKVEALLNDVGIADPMQRYSDYPHQLSGGMKQRVMIAIALAGEPELLIADEPTTALDVTIQAQVLTLLKKLQQERGMALLLITHDLGVVSEMADTVGVMYAGQLVEEATRAQFFSQAKHPYSQKLFESLPNIEKRDQPLAVIHGAVPSLAASFSGCRFAERCDFSEADCHQHLPRWIDQGAGHGLRCHMVDPAYTGAFKNNAEELPPFQPVVSAVENVIKNLADAVPLLAVRDLKMHFQVRNGLFNRNAGKLYAVDGLSLQIEKGRTLALVGESGCGKTTVGKAILQLNRPTSGEVLFEGDDLTQISDSALRFRRNDFQIIFQDPFSSMNPRMKVVDIIREGMVTLGIGGSDAEQLARVDQLLMQVGLPLNVCDRYPHEFSGGQRQRICIARALAVNPKLIICDEPTSALDVSVQAQILNLLKESQQTMGLSYLFITHNLSVVSYLADEVAVMYLGRIVEQGTVEDVLNNPQHPYTQALISAIPVIDKTDGRTLIRLEGDLPSPASPPAGCHFHTRCPKVMAQCRDAYPDSLMLSDSHSVGCFLYEEVSK